MKQEDVFKSLIRELFDLKELRQEYQDNDTHYVIDLQKEGNTLTIKVQLLENKDKKEFETWLENIDDNLFAEVLDELDDIPDLNTIYNSDNYKEVINLVKSKTKEIANRKIEELKKLLN